MSHDRSLNGGKTRPLTDAGWRALAGLADGPAPASTFNAGIKDRLTRTPEPLAVLVQLPSPFKGDRGDPRAHLRITDAGRRALQERGQ